MKLLNMDLDHGKDDLHFLIIIISRVFFLVNDESGKYRNGSIMTFDYHSPPPTSSSEQMQCIHCNTSFSSKVCFFPRDISSNVYC